MKIRIEHTSWTIDIEPGQVEEVTISHDGSKSIKCSSGELYLLGQAIKAALSKEAR